MMRWSGWRKGGIKVNKAMSEIRFDIQTVQLQDRSWHAEATTSCPEPMLFVERAPEFETALYSLTDRIGAWMKTFPQPEPELFSFYRINDEVEHVRLPGVLLVVKDGPTEGAASGRALYKVQLPSGEVVPVLGANLRVLKMAGEAGERRHMS